MKELAIDRISSMVLYGNNYAVGDFVFLEMKYINHSSSLRFSLRENGERDGTQSAETCVVLGEQLTVTYS